MYNINNCPKKLKEAWTKIKRKKFIFDVHRYFYVKN